MKKKISALLAVIIALTSLTACGGTTAETTETTDTAVTTAAESETTTAGTTEATSAVINVASPLTDEQANQVVAGVNAEGIENPEFFDIKYSDFYNEYIFNLNYRGIDEANADNAETCEQYRSSIINYLTLEKIIQRVAEENGVGLDSFTEDEMTEIEATVASTLSSWYSSYEAEAKAELGDSATDEEILAKEKELFSAYLANANLTTDIFTQWQKSTAVQEKLFDKLLADITVTDEQVQEFIDSTIADAKAAWESDPATFESNSTYTAVYVPEGTKNIREILLKIDNDSITQILQLRTDGDDAGADALRDEKLAERKSEVDNIISLLESGSSFAELAETYNEDSVGSTEFSVLPNSSNWNSVVTENLATLENVGDYTQALVTDYGYLILQYSSDDAVTEDEMEQLKSDAKDYLISEKKNAESALLTSQWQEQYPYTIDYAAINVTEPTEETTEETTEATDETAETTAE